MSHRTGVVVMAHGTPQRLEELPAFYASIRGGRLPAPAELAELEQHYLAIGGVSPLNARTAAQVEGLRRRLEDLEPGRYEVVFGAKHTRPSIESAVERLGSAGVDVVIGLVLTPHRSTLGSGEYLARAAAAAAGIEHPPAFVPIEQWYDAPGFAELIGARVQRALRSLRPGDGVRHRAQAAGRVGTTPAAVVFTAHSLPARAVPPGDPYEAQVEDSAARAARAARLADQGITWRVAWQSAGRSGGPWIGPDLGEVLADLAGTPHVDAVVVCPIGFVADHLEVLYDLDVVAAATARRLGLRFVRTASLNDDPTFVDLLAEVVRKAAPDAARGALE